MGPRKVHKLSSTSYNFIEQFLTEQWYIVREDQGNADSKDRVSIDIIWESFQSFMTDRRYSQTLCNKILLGKLLHKSGVEKIKRGPRKQQRFYYFPIRPVEGSKTEEIYRKHKAMEDLEASFVSPPRDVKSWQHELSTAESGASATACFTAPRVPLKLKTSTQDNPKVGVPFRGCNIIPCSQSFKSVCTPAPVCCLDYTLSTDDTQRGVIEGGGNKTIPPQCAASRNVCCLHRGRFNSGNKSSTLRAGINNSQVTNINSMGNDLKYNTNINTVGTCITLGTDINTVGNNSAVGADINTVSNCSAVGTDINTSDNCSSPGTIINLVENCSAYGIDINTMDNGFKSYQDINNVCNGPIQYSNITSNGNNNVMEQDCFGETRWQNSVANIKNEDCTVLDGWSARYLDTHNSLSSGTLSYTDGFDPLFCPSSSVRADHQNAPAAGREVGEHSGWNDMPYEPNFINHSMYGPFTCWGTETSEGVKPLDLTTSNK